ncbi:MAG: hypothetical protein UV71_C0004G0011 [Microgenomates group bacterium GW2011_GWC1_43_13]|uniref:Uncharacterized protein n=2 Tax=Candidatus Woeseibacteriota TaxID=1752722 RepID=A0A1F8DI50_9BACT|nr:MAG: hypothetical protein UV71_C0004G0011 [Microgenomates group bacterium GW2011_GWC1_43_13]KKT32992.1 MAG: hypothetical protein UW20_C0006G0009 [Candidatus Woesebacteria bacterium GW2011_GWB1_44_11]OGM75925.1 MAG: hypothetical protein A2208_01400 [Candidatus Woesebacteria bacterium RIFOXYA1_FULL_43_16]OGM81456.1 MAG: hypothetical protein A2394_02970 [Candidatus Woesebacteria bacterium RIFOXYB1_FULL_42_36]OGM88287.1 MAG: hypothetical protein A2573_02630 [Candidatus Woesebacteria bacterium RI
MSEKDNILPGGRIESGAEYLKRIGEEYTVYNQFLPGLSDQAFQYQKEINARREMGVESFLGDFAIAAEERRRNVVRWRVGDKLPEATEERTAIIRSALPRFVMFDKEAVGGMRVEQAKRHKIDVVVEDIMTEVARRLPKTLDAYRYHQDYANDVLQVPSVGKLDVRLTQTANGIFSTINSINGDDFKIWNCRESGVKYLDRYNEISRPQDVEIKPKGIKLEIYSDDSGIVSEEPGKFKKLQDEAIVWLVDNVLNPIRKIPLPEKQIDLPLMEEPFPEGKVGPLFAFVKQEDIEKIEILKEVGVNSAYPDERIAVQPSWRLIPLGYNRGDLPEEVHDGFIWCGVGTVNADADLKKLRIADKQMNTWSIFSKEGLAEIKPLVATDIYVVDWQAWEDFRENAFKPGHDRLTDSEVVEMYKAMGKTFVPITEYKGDYKKPVVLIGRDLEVNEVGGTFIPPEKRRR